VTLICDSGELLLQHRALLQQSKHAVEAGTYTVLLNGEEVEHGVIFHTCPSEPIEHDGDIGCRPVRAGGEPLKVLPKIQTRFLVLRAVPCEMHTLTVTYTPFPPPNTPVPAGNVREEAVGSSFDTEVSEVEFLVADPRTLSLQPCSGGVRKKRQERGREREQGDAKVGGHRALLEDRGDTSTGAESIGERTLRERGRDEITLPIAWLAGSGGENLASVCYEVLSEVCPAGVVLWEKIRQMPTLTSYPGFYWYGKRAQPFAIKEP